MDIQRKVFIMGTTANVDILEDMGVVDSFNVTLSCPMVKCEAEAMEVSHPMYKKNKKTQLQIDRPP